VSRQAIETQNSGSGHCTRVALGGRVGSAKRKVCDRGVGRCLALGGVRGLPGGLEPSSA